MVGQKLFFVASGLSAASILLFWLNEFSPLGDQAYSLLTFAKSQIADRIPWRSEAKLTAALERIAKAVGERCVNDYVPINCAALFAGNNKSVDLAMSYKFPDEQRIMPEIILDFSPNCRLLLEIFKFNNETLSKEEYSFPIAYVILAPDSFHQLMMLLIRIYWPHNAYCIHVDQTKSEEYMRAVMDLSTCLGNLTYTEQGILGTDGFSNLLAADLCLGRLNDIQQDWKYAVILGSRDYPLRTNLEMIQILQAFAGANDIGLSGELSGLIPHPDFFSDTPDYGRFTSEVNIYEGSFAATLSRDFVRFLFNDSYASKTLQLLSLVHKPDEKYWATVGHNLALGAPGAFPGQCLVAYRNASLTKPFITRMKNCDRMTSNGECILGVSQLPELRTAPHFGAQGFSIDNEPATLLCWDELLCNRTHFEANKELKVSSALNLTFYQNLVAVRYHKMANKEEFDCF